VRFLKVPAGGNLGVLARWIEAVDRLVTLISQQFPDLFVLVLRADRHPQVMCGRPLGERRND
jgi:hypothetical protein